MSRSSYESGSEGSDESGAHSDNDSGDESRGSSETQSGSDLESLSNSGGSSAGSEGGYEDGAAEADSEIEELDEEDQYRTFLVGQRYHERQDDLVDQLEDAISHGDKKEIRRLFRVIDREHLESKEEQLRNAFWEAENPDLFGALEGPIAFSDEELEEALLKVIRGAKPRVFANALVQLCYSGARDLWDVWVSKRNSFDTVEMFSFWLPDFSDEEEFTTEVRRLEALITIDDKVDGCSLRAQVILQIVTSLDYEVQRHDKDSFPCSIRRELIEALDIDKTCAGFTTSRQFVIHLRKKQTEYGTYFGVDLSDDSDEEKERLLRGKPRNLFQRRVNRSKRFAEKLGVSLLKHRITPKPVVRRKKKVAGTEAAIVGKKPLLQAEPEFKVGNFHGPMHFLLVSPVDSEVQRDLAKLNRDFAEAFERDVLAVLLASIKTQFRIAEYRGITYTRTGWNKEARRFHRTWSEIGKAIHCPAAYVAAGVDFKHPSGRRAMIEAPIRTRAALDLEALKIKQFLLQLRRSGSVVVEGTTYAHLGDALQEEYTRDYCEYSRLLLRLGFHVNANPFVSAADVPYHAIKYALGLKPYDGDEYKLLLPCWRKNGLCERPKVGKVYISFHPLTDYGPSGAYSVPQKLYRGEIERVPIVIAQERERTFPGLMESGRVISVLIAKYPSFDGPHSPFHLSHYGLNEENYNAFKEAMRIYPPHSKEREYVEQLLGRWLNAFYQLELVAKVQQYASKQSVVLVYQKYDGTFDFIPGPATPYARDVPPDTKRAAKRGVKARQEMEADSPDIPSAVRKLKSSARELDELSLKLSSLQLGSTSKYLSFVSFPKQAGKMNKGTLLKAGMFSSRRKVRRPVYDMGEFRVYLMSNFGLDSIAVRGDGNCQFRAIAKRLKVLDPVAYSQSEETVMNNLRQEGVNDIEDNFFDFEPVLAPMIGRAGVNPQQDIVYTNYANYYDRMRGNGHYGDQLTLRALARVIQRPIIVLEPSMMRDLTALQREHGIYRPDGMGVGAIDINEAVILIFDGVGHYETVSTLPNESFTALLEGLDNIAPAPG